MQQTLNDLFLKSTKTAEQKRLYKLLIALAKEGTNPC